MNDVVRTAAAIFFDTFVEAFHTFDGQAIAQRYLPPYLAMHADGTLACFTTHSEVAQYFQKVVDEYHAKGCRSCRYKDLEVVAVSANYVLGTVTWELLYEDGSVMSSWRESYNLSWIEDQMRIFASVDHAE
jgi:hypothetical protein